MRRARGWVHCLPATVVLLTAGAGPSCGYQLGTRWSATALSGSGLSQGDPTTVTWGLVADGVSIAGSEGTSGSDLVRMLNETIGTSDVWMPLFEDAMNRWGEVSGLTFVHEPNNSLEPIDSSRSPVGLAGAVPDIRIGGHSIDGASGSNTVAYNYYPNHGDMVIDTDNAAYFGNATSGYRRLRNTVMHEVGHGLGIDHVESSSGNVLMEPNIGTSFDGPQLDDIMAVQRLYGDAWEKNGGNDSAATATLLGVLDNDMTSIGTDASDLVVAADDVDFVSIDDNSDLDYFAFSIVEPSWLDATLTPKGPTYNQGPAGETQSLFDSSAQSDLTLRIYDTDGLGILASANGMGLGEAETVSDLLLMSAGTYYAQVSGLANTMQLYQLDLAARPWFLPGDVNLDGRVSLGTGDPVDDDVAAFIAGWQTVVPTDDDTTAWRKGDLNLDRLSDLADFTLLRQALRDAALDQQQPQSANVSEPASALVLLLGSVLIGVLARLRR